MTTLLPNAYLDQPSVVWCWEWYLTSQLPDHVPVDVRRRAVPVLDARSLSRATSWATCCSRPGCREAADQLPVERCLRGPPAGRSGQPAPGRHPAGADPRLPELDGRFRSDRVRSDRLRHCGNGVHGHLGAVARDRPPRLGGRPSIAGSCSSAISSSWTRRLRTVTVQHNLFRGETLALADDPGTVSLVARAFDLAELHRARAEYARRRPTGRRTRRRAASGSRCPRASASAAGFPASRSRPRPTTTTLFQQTFTAARSRRTCSPCRRISSTPAWGPFGREYRHAARALLATVDYWVIAFDDDNVQLALTQGDALTGTKIDITTVGTGTHTHHGRPRAEPERGLRPDRRPREHRHPARSGKARARRARRPATCPTRR